MIPQQISASLAQAATTRVQTGHPLVTLSYAQSLDGSITTRRGRPTALSGPQAMTLTHQLRAAHDAVLVGIGTVLADDPGLTVRLAEGPNPQPIIVDSRLRCPLDVRLMREHPLPLWLATTKQADPARQQAFEAAGAVVLRLPATAAGRVDLAALCQCLGDLHINSLMIEGGAEIITSALSEQLADQMLLTIAPRFIGGLHAVEPVKQSLPTLRNMQYDRLGDDLIVWGKLK